MAYPKLIKEFTWATKPAASAYVGQMFMSDVGVNGSLWYSDGSNIGPISSDILLYNSYLNLIIPSLAAANAATYSQSGTTLVITCVGHNIPPTVHNGKRVYLQPGTPTTGSQLPEGLYTDFTYVDANTFTCTAPLSQTGTGSLNTQTSAITVPDFSVLVKGGLLGKNGYVDVMSHTMMNASTGTKRASFLYDTFSFKNPSQSSTSVAQQELHRFQNRNSENKQVALAVASAIGPATSVASVLGSIDSTINKYITCSVTLNTALDFLAFEHVTVQITPDVQ